MPAPCLTAVPAQTMECGAFAQTFDRLCGADNACGGLEEPDQTSEFGHGSPFEETQQERYKVGARALNRRSRGAPCFRNRRFAPAPSRARAQRYTATFTGPMGFQMCGPMGDNVGEMPLMVSSVTETATANGVNVNDRIVAINDESVASVSAIDFANKVAVAKLDGPVKITFETRI